MVFITLLWYIWQLMKLQTGTSVIGSNFLRIKSDFAIVILVFLKSDINLKLNEGTGSNWYPQNDKWFWM